MGAQPGCWVRLLGIPFWESFDPNIFFEQLYARAKGKLASWSDKTHYLTNLARGRVANTMYLSLFRYWLNCMLPPTHIHEAIKTDLQAFTWAKDLDMDPDEVGCATKFRRWMKEGAQYGSRTVQPGLGILPWDEHCKAIRTRWIFRYLDASRGDYKQVLDCWFARLREGRSAVFSTIPTHELTKSTTYRDAALPPFWRQALIDFRDAPIAQAFPNKFTSSDEASAIPIWHNHLFTITNRAYYRSWRETLDIIRIRDTIMPDTNYHYPDYAIEEKILSSFRKAGANAIHAAAGKVVTVKTLLRQWASILNKIPDSISRTARNITNPDYIPYGMGAVLLRRMGWKEGTSLGLTPGITTPIDTPPGTAGRAGLGAAQQAALICGAWLGWARLRLGAAQARFGLGWAWRKLG